MGIGEAESRKRPLLRLTLCLRNNTMSDTSSIHFLAVNHGGCKQTLRLVFPTDAHYTHLPFLANYISQSLNLDRHKTKKGNAKTCLSQTRGESSVATERLLLASFVQNGRRDTAVQRSSPQKKAVAGIRRKKYL